MKLAAAAAALLLVAPAVWPGEPGPIHADFPLHVDRHARYVVYAHGRIVEGADERPVSPDFGVYDFPEIRAALVSGGGFVLIAPQRPADADPEEAARTLVAGVRRLVAAGVPPARITLVGFSRGGYIAALAAAQLPDQRINTAILAICVNGLPSGRPLSLTGNVLSIYETSDEVGSCGELAKLSETARFEEVAISTGLKHGAFYRARAAWLEPLLDWIARTNR